MSPARTHRGLFGARSDVPSDPTSPVASRPLWRAAIAAVLPVVLLVATSAVRAAGPPGRYQELATYVLARGGDAVLVLEDDRLVLEQYADGVAAHQPHPLFSGSKGFACLAAARAVADGKLAWDEPLARLLPEWSAAKGRITLRALLSLGSGLDPMRGTERDSDEVLGQTVRAALAASVIAPPGRRFGYGPYPFLAFTEVAERATGESIDSYLERQVLAPLGIHVFWMRTADDHPHLADGAWLTARDWLQIGKLVRDNGRWEGREVVPATALAECFKPSQANRAYGMGWWLGGRGEERHVVARGNFNQRLYVFPERKRVVVVLGKPGARAGERFSEASFVRLLARLPAAK